VLSFTLDGMRTEDVGKVLDEEGIAVRAGHHCAQPILRRFGQETTVRATLALYNTCEDIDALVAALHRIQAEAAAAASNARFTLPTTNYSPLRHRDTEESGSHDMFFVSWAFPLSPIQFRRCSILRGTRAQNEKSPRHAARKIPNINEMRGHNEDLVAHGQRLLTVGHSRVAFPSSLAADGPNFALSYTIK